MNHERMGNFICEQRKAKGLTQKQLAERLDITDKAVSKWERGMGYPDVTMLTKLADALGVTTTELLNGGREESTAPKAETLVQNALQYAEKVTVTNSRATRNIMLFGVAGLSVLAIIVCVICNLAISEKLTWALYPLVSIVFAWLVITPQFVFRNRKMEWTLLSLCVFLIPFLACIERVSNTVGWLRPIGIPISIAAMVYLWFVLYPLKKIKNKWYASGIALGFLLPFNIVVNAVLARTVGEPLFDVWDALAAGIVAVLLAVFLIIGYARNQKRASKS